LFQVIFWHGHQQYVLFFAVLYLPQDGVGQLFSSDGEGILLQALLEGGLGLFNATDEALYCKNDLVLCENVLFTMDFIFCSVSFKS
jgi:hypothetical protein